MKAKSTFRRIFLGVAVSMFLAINACDKQQGPAKSKQSATPVTERQLSLSRKPWTGDFDKMFEQRKMRVVVPYSRSLYFNDKGREMGFSAETVRDFERWINKKYVKVLGKIPLTVLIIPETRENLLPDVVRGEGDIAVGNLTVTEQRLKTVDFASPPDWISVNELVITGPKSSAIVSAEDLSGKTVHVRKSSSYYESLNLLNERFKKEGKPAVKLVLVPDALEDEDMMEMLNAGLMGAIVVDNWKAKMWAQILPKIKVNDQAIVRQGGKIGWAIRKGSPKLEEEILDFYTHYLKKQGVAAERLKKYMSRVKQMKNPTGTKEWQRFEEILALFRRYGEKYNFDPLMLAAQGFQESELDQRKISRMGAIGVMQIMPATGKRLKVGNIRILKNNIHTGAKFMDYLMTVHFHDANFKGNNRTLFAFASYNCGPGNVSMLRKEAAKNGYDPNEWFNNVEIVASQKIGIETTMYVRNIFKYYVAYKLQLDAIEADRRARERVLPETGK